MMHHCTDLRSMWANDRQGTRAWPRRGVPCGLVLLHGTRATVTYRGVPVRHNTAEQFAVSAGQPSRITLDKFSLHTHQRCSSTSDLRRISWSVVDSIRYSGHLESAWITLSRHLLHCTSGQFGVCARHLSILGKICA
jgi:hypothetical protein